jgi:trigger factor
VKKVVDLALSVLFNQRLNLLGTPLPKVNENFDWDAEELTFEYEMV